MQEGFLANKDNQFSEEILFFMVLTGSISNRPLGSAQHCHFASFNQAIMEVVRAAEAVVNSPFTSSIFMARAF